MVADLLWVTIRLASGQSTAGEQLPCPQTRGTLCAFRPSHARSPGQRTDEELELIFEELLHIKAVAHLSNSVSLPAPYPPQEPLSP